MTVRSVLAAALLLTAPLCVFAQTNTFSYQGYLTASGAAADGAFDFELALYNVDTGGSAIGVNAFDDVTVTGGLFELDADFTGAPFEAGGSYWVEARVRDGASTGGYTPLLPRQAVNASPYAIAAQAVIAPLDVAGDANVQGALTVGGDITTVNEVRAGRVEADELSSDGAVDFTGGVAIQRFGDNVALVVGNDGPTQPAARIVGELEVESLSCGTGSECISLDTLPSGLYRTKSDLYEASVTEAVPGLLGRTITARCTREGDQPLSGYCPTQSLNLKYTEASHWTSDGMRSEYSCNYSNSLSGDIDGETVIICIAGP